MAFLNGITFLLLFQLAGEILVRWLQWPLPGPVLGMLLLFAALVIRGSLAAELDAAVTGLLSHLSLLFVPAGVGVMVHFRRIGTEWLPIVLTLLFSTALTLVATALIMKLAGRLMRNNSGASDE